MIYIYIYITKYNMEHTIERTGSASLSLGTSINDIDIASLSPGEQGVNRS